MKTKRIKDYSLLYLAFFVYSLVSVFSKTAAKQSSFWMMIFFMGVEVILLAIYALIWQQALKRFSLVVAMSNKGITIIMSLLWSILIFREKITINNLIGAVIVVFGIYMVSVDD